MAVTPSASYSLTVRVEITNRPGMLGRVTSAIGEAGGDTGAVDIVELVPVKTRDDLSMAYTPGVARVCLAPSGVGRIVALDEHGILAPGRTEPMDAMKAWVARETNPGDQRGRLADAPTTRTRSTNVLCFPGFFRGLLDCRATRVTDDMKLAAGQAIASIVSRRELHEEYIIPSVFNKKVAPAVAREVIKAAQKGGVARRRWQPPPPTTREAAS